MVKFSKKRARFLIDALKPARRTRIVDVGANPIGDCPYQGLKDMGGCEVIGFEPQEDAFKAVVAAAGDNESYLPYAVGDGKQSTLHITKGSGFTSLLEPNTKLNEFLGRFWAGMRVTDTVDVKTHRMDDIDELPEFDLLKIDIQGGEQAVFKGGKKKLANAVAVISEVAAIPIYKEQPLLDAQMSTLGKLGFSLHKFMFFKRVRCTNRLSRNLEMAPHKNQLLDGDAVFVRGLMEFDALSDEMLKHIIILADTVFGSVDLATEAMVHLIDRGALQESVGTDYIEMINGGAKNLEAAE